MLARLRFVATLALALASASCGDDGSTGDAGSTTAGSGTSTGTTTTSPTSTSTATTTGTTSGTSSTSGGSTGGSTGGSPLLGECLITHDGGDPATASVTRVGSDGTLMALDTVVLPGAHRPTFLQRNTITRCGDDIYFVLESDQAIARAEFLPAGSLVGITSQIQLAPVEAISCDDDADVVLGIVHGGDSVTAVRYVVERSGALSIDALATLTFAFPSVTLIHAALHPTLPLLYVDATSDDGLFTELSQVTAVDYGTAGQLTPGATVQIGAGPLPTLGLYVTPDAAVMYFAGFEASCGAYHELPADGAVPSSANLFVDCTVWDNSMGAAFRSSDAIFYQKQSAPNVVRIGEFDAGLTNHGTVPGATPMADLELAHDDSVLIEGGQDGVLTTYTVSPDGLTLTNADTLDIGDTNDLTAMLVVPCE